MCGILSVIAYLELHVKKYTRCYVHDEDQQNKWCTIIHSSRRSLRADAWSGL